MLPCIFNSLWVAPRVQSQVWVLKVFLALVRCLVWAFRSPVPDHLPERGFFCWYTELDSSGVKVPSDRVKPERNLPGRGDASRGKAKQTFLHRLKSRNRRMRTRMFDGVGGEESRGFACLVPGRFTPQGTGTGGRAVSVHVAQRFATATAVFGTKIIRLKIGCRGVSGVKARARAPGRQRSVGAAQGFVVRRRVRC